MNWYRTFYAQTSNPWIEQLKHQVMTGNPLNLCEPPASLCPATLGIERSQMPQFDGIEGQEFLDSLRQNGVQITQEEVAIGSLKASQSDINAQSVRSALGDISHPNDEEQYVQKSPLLISQDNYVLDGHHRWAALLVYSYVTRGDASEPCPVIRIGLPIQQLIQTADASPFSEREDINNNRLPTTPAPASPQ